MYYQQKTIVVGETVVHRSVLYRNLYTLFSRWVVDETLVFRKNSDGFEPIVLTRTYYNNRFYLRPTQKFGFSSLTVQVTAWDSRRVYGRDDNNY